MAKINKTEVYPLKTPLSKEDFSIGTQASTGKTINLSIGEISKVVQEEIEVITAPIKEVYFNNELLPIEEHKIDLPNKLSNFINDSRFEETEGFEPFDYSSLLTTEI
ncbi:hypothetical protein ACKUSY_05690 [Myroides odoratus]